MTFSAPSGTHFIMLGALFEHESAEEISLGFSFSDHSTIPSLQHFAFHYPLDPALPCGMFTQLVLLNPFSRRDHSIRVILSNILFTRA